MKPVRLEPRERNARVTELGHVLIKGVDYRANENRSNPLLRRSSRVILGRIHRTRCSS